ncbi:uncharacterized protein N7515_005442 [Penicillium bovifimosum]|uniref:Uncharacterized protein n=1 Tax=Penicillium bovifimosum TaxID=126998 RepID=A0A9W9GT43_9EURO|nr:uncharacterized protein N7515_005442 [Penicillium bovifimosum]KAJ5129403.1 hypothetical protein N7515_005442 [Penicillium bovifimosum]
MRENPELAYFKPVFRGDYCWRLCHLVLTPPPEGVHVGPRVFERRKAKEYNIHAEWASDEQMRLKRVIAEIDTSGPDFLRPEELEDLKKRKSNVPPALKPSNNLP